MEYTLNIYSVSERLNPQGIRELLISAQLASSSVYKDWNGGLAIERAEVEAMSGANLPEKVLNYMKSLCELYITEQLAGLDQDDYSAVLGENTYTF